MEEAAKICTCRRRWFVRIHQPCGVMSPIKAEISCGDRIGCVLCAHARAGKVAIRVEKLFAGVERPKFLTLTVKNVPTITTTTYGELRRSFTRFRRILERIAPGALRGGVYVIETTFHAKGSSRKSGGVYERDEWHPHIHVLIDSGYIPQATLSDLWSEATHGWGHMVDIRAADKGSIAELAKYPTKQLDLAGDNLRLFRAVMRGQKLVVPFGSMYGVKLEDDKDHEDEDRELAPECSCGLVGPWHFETVLLTITEATEAVARGRGPSP